MRRDSSWPLAAALALLLGGCAESTNTSATPNDANGPVSPPSDGNDTTPGPGDGNQSVPDPNAPAVAVDPNCAIATANSKGVGTPCAAGPAACARLAANTCSSDYYAAYAPFCTMACAAQADCGEGASCMAAPGNPQAYGCIPDACIPDGTPRNPSPPPLAACLPPNGTANGIGKPCTRGGRQCSGKASTCTADLLSNPPLSMCTIVLCSGDAQCGAGARCVAAPGSTSLKACTPTSCLP